MHVNGQVQTSFTESVQCYVCALPDIGSCVQWAMKVISVYSIASTCSMYYSNAL